MELCGRGGTDRQDEEGRGAVFWMKSFFCKVKFVYIGYLRRDRKNKDRKILSTDHSQTFLVFTYS